MVNAATVFSSPSKEAELVAEERSPGNRYSPYGDPGKYEKQPPDNRMDKFKIIVKKKLGRLIKGSRAPSRMSQ